MTHILNLAEAALYVDDLERAVDFYVRVIGLPITARFEEACFMQTGPESTLILFDREKLVHRKSTIPAHGAHGSGHLALAIPVAEMQTWRERLHSFGIAIEHEQDWPQGTHSIYFRDPDGNSLELIDSRHYPQIWDELQIQV